MNLRSSVLVALPLALVSACSSGSSSPQGLLAPAAPAQLTFTVVGPDTILLAWRDTTQNETGFRIERGPSPFEVIVDLPANTTSYTEAVPPNRAPFEYRLRSYNQAGDSDISNSIVFKPSDPPAPVITGFRPASAFEGGSGALTVEGVGLANFGAGPNTITFDGAPAASIEVVDDERVRVRPPAGIMGLVDVTVTNANGSFTSTSEFAYATWPPILSATDRRIDTDAAGTAESDSVEFAVDGDRIYAVWADERNGSLDVYFNRSLDRGQTWFGADRRLDSDVTGASASDIGICSSGENVYVVWRDARNGSGDIFFNRSLDGGVTWLPAEVRIDTIDAGLTGSTAPRIACSGDNVYIAWSEEEFFFFFSINDVYVNRSADAGATWLAEEVQLDSGFGDSVCVEIDASTEVATVVWQDDRDGFPDIYVNSSFDDGLTWQAEPVRVNSSARGSTRSITPVIAVSGMNVHVAWEDDIDIGLDIYTNRSLDGGLTWLPLSPRANTNPPGSSNSQRPRIVVDRESVFVVWEDSRGIREPRFNRSLDAGMTWLNADVLVSPDAVAFNVQVATSGGNVFVVWEDGRAGQRDIYLSSSRDEGVSFQPLDVQVNDDVPGASGSRNARVAANGTHAYVLWADFRNGQQDIYFRDTSDPLQQP